jgi:hypothetical protein
MFDSVPDNYDEEVDGIYYRQCSECEGQETWCSCCEMWSQDCCQEYGTCQCS